MRVMTAINFIKEQEAIPTHELPEESRECAICTTYFGYRMAEGTIEHAIKLSCNHTVGSLCLQKWLEKSNQCVFCRTKLFEEIEDEDDFEATDDNFIIRETTIGEEELRLLEHFENTRLMTSDEIDRREATENEQNPSEETENNVDTAAWRAASSRRRADFYSRELYEEFRNQQIRSGMRESEALPRLMSYEVTANALGWVAAFNLFKLLRKEGAFTLTGMFELRFSLLTPSDEALYEHLLNQGAKWSISRRGWYLYGERMPLGEISANEERFLDLQSQGAFRTLGITRSFRDVSELFDRSVQKSTPSDWDVYVQIKQDRMQWDEADGCWWNETHTSVAYGDLPSNPRLRSEKIFEDNAGNLSCSPDATVEVRDWVHNLHIREGERPTY
ncbi:hypothetical protein ACLMJK_002390 [Lecanora helva]